MGPFWFTPGNLKWRGGGFLFVETVIGVEAVFGVGVEASEPLGDSIAGGWLSFDETGAMPQRPRTQPPTRRPKVADLRGTGVAVELVLLLSADAMEADSEARLFPAAMEASSERDD